MRPIFIVLAAALLLQTAMGQSAVSPDDYARLMQSNTAAIAAVDNAVKSRAFSDARISIGVLRKNLMSMRGFWSARQRPDAVRVVSEGVNSLTMLEELLGRQAKEVQVERSMGVVQEVRALLASKELAKPN